MAKCKECKYRQYDGFCERKRKIVETNDEICDKYVNQAEEYDAIKALEKRVREDMRQEKCEE